MTDAKNSSSSQALIVVRSISFRSESTSLNGGMVGFSELSFTFTGRQHNWQTVYFAGLCRTDDVVSKKLTVHGGNVGELRGLVIDYD
jgi:hypothetical protein